MKKASLLTAIGLLAIVLFAGGCVSQEEYNTLLDNNQRQADELTNLRRDLRNKVLLLSKCQKQLDTLKGLSTPEMQALQEKISMLNDDIAKKVDLIKRMKAELLRGGPQLPMELSMALKEFAQNNDMVTFDEITGVLKFKSDLLFKSGSAKVLEGAKQGVGVLVDIMNSPTAKEFDMVIAGHTDSDRIRHAKHLHATNWHLSAHRAIGVLQLMDQKGIDAERLSVRGFGPHRPVASNDDKKGKAANRRVEIYVVAKGM